MTQNVPLVDIAAQQREIIDEIRPEIDEILVTGAFIGGRHVARFEEAFANLIGVDHCIGVANGTDGLEIALRAAGVTSEHEVVLPANTFIATAEAVERIGARTVLVDADVDAMLMDPTLIQAAISERTGAVVPVHLYGQAAPVEQIASISRPESSIILEDAAQSQGASRFGAPAGSLGDIAATSFYPGKNLGAAGDAGAVMTSDDELARVCRLLSAHGSATKYVHEISGFNSRLDAIQAVVLLAKLARLDRWNSVRREAASRYHDLLADVSEIRLPATLEGNVHVWHIYPVRVPERDKVLQLLNEDGIGAAIHYPTPVHLSPAFAHLGYGKGDFPVSENAANSLLSLPIYGHITAEQQERVASSLRNALNRV
ncbi:DegT/DnrJ/EryC1/StrS family aminotransferase [Jatrophihabitans sp. DSM 45814]